MNPLTKTELSEINAALDATVPSLPLLSRSRDVALIHALRYFDAYTTTCGSIPEPGQREIAGSDSLYAFDHAVRWIFRFCGPHSGRPNLTIDADVYQEANELHALARQYAKVWDIMSHLFRGTLVGSCDELGVIRVSYSSQLVKDLDIAGRLLAAPYDPEVQLGEGVETPELVAKMTEGVKILASGGHTLRYFAPQAIFDELSERIDRLTASRWELEPSWDLGYPKAVHTRLAFRITAGDEFQCVFSDIAKTFEILTYLRATLATSGLEPIVRFRASIGVGEISVAGKSSPYEEDGEAFAQARRGLEQLEKGRHNRWTK